jgi:hypothetical protein
LVVRLGPLHLLRLLRPLRPDQGQVLGPAAGMEGLHAPQSQIWPTLAGRGT